MTELHPVVGHEEVRRALARGHAAGGLPSTLLLHGSRGVGKQRLALWVAQLQFCDTPGPEGPCGSCRPCRLTLGLEHPDLHWYFPLPRPKGVAGDRLADALEVARIDAINEIRDEPVRATTQGDELLGLYLGLIQGLRRKAMSRPSMAPVQVFIIADAEALVPQASSPEAANALLKLLEEPPGGTRFVLTSGEPGRLLPTIRSRSIPLHLSPLPRDQVAAFLQEHRGVSLPEALQAATLGQGSIGRALGFLGEGDDTGGLAIERQRALHLVRAALAGDRGAGYLLALEQSSSGARTLVDRLAFVEEWLRDLAAVAAGAEDQVLGEADIPELQRLVASANVHPSAPGAALPAVEEARRLAGNNVNPQLIITGLVQQMRKVLRTPTAAARSP